MLVPDPSEPESRWLFLASVPILPLGLIRLELCLTCRHEVIHPRGQTMKCTNMIVLQNERNLVLRIKTVVKAYAGSRAELRYTGAANTDTAKENEEIRVVHLRILTDGLPAVLVMIIYGRKALFYGGSNMRKGHARVSVASNSQVSLFLSQPPIRPEET